jgi:hypothetical protein
VQLKVFSISFIALLLASLPGFADSLNTLPTEERGWISCLSDACTGAQSTNGTQDDNSYYAGIEESFGGDGAEFRNWFEFDLSSIGGTVTSATLQIDTGTYIPYETTSETYQLSSLPSAFGFNDLGTGAVYATQAYTAADDGVTLTITLDAAAIADIQADEGGAFGLGGLITTLQQTIAGTADEAVFSSVNGDPTQVELNVYTSNSGPAAPEPASLPLFAAGLGAIWVLWRAQWSIFRR